MIDLFSDFPSRATHEIRRCGFRGILPISEPTMTCGLGRICANVDRLHEITGTRPDYLMNRDDQKNEGPSGKKLHGNREIFVE